MGSKEILTEIKANLEKSLDAWEGFLDGIEAALVGEDWTIAEKVSGPIVESVKRIDQALKANGPVKKLIPGDNSTTSSEICSVCRLLLDRKSIDWEFMKETNTWQIICKNCAEILKNYKGGK